MKTNKILKIKWSTGYFYQLLNYILLKNLSMLPTFRGFKIILASKVEFLIIPLKIILYQEFIPNV